MTIKLPDSHGVLARLTGELSNHGANIVTLGTFYGDDPTNREIAFKVQDIDRATLEKILTDLQAEVVDLRESL